MPDPLTQILALPLQRLALNPPPPPSVLFQVKYGTLLIPSVVHAHYLLLPALIL